ncbi:MAG TPA: hypothetical protein VFB52_02525 [Solirubrobacterales bacterium]|nr:hypothetical protein [Solirubrobacterales bacterium]
MRARSLTCACLAAIAAALLVAGCGGGREEDTPVACLEGAAAYKQALAKAPAAVQLEGTTPIEDCLSENQDGGQLAIVGEAMIEVATELNAEARQDPGNKATLQLGYLIGAAERGAEKTEGIHADLIRRLVVAARFAPGGEPLSPAFLAVYKEGFDAGRQGGWLPDS